MFLSYSFTPFSFFMQIHLFHLIEQNFSTKSTIFRFSLYASTAMLIISSYLGAFCIEIMFWKTHFTATKLKKMISTVYRYDEIFKFSKSRCILYFYSLY